MERRDFADSEAPQPYHFTSEMFEYLEKSTSASTISTAFAPMKHAIRTRRVNNFFIIEIIKLKKNE
jgi:hypothetical protein